jgi:hypothetical protein
MMILGKLSRRKRLAPELEFAVGVITAAYDCGGDLKDDFRLFQFFDAVADLLIEETEENAEFTPLVSSDDLVTIRNLVAAKYGKA